MELQDMYHVVLKLKFWGKGWKGDKHTDSNDNMEQVEKKVDVHDEKKGKSETSALKKFTLF